MNQLVPDNEDVARFVLSTRWVKQDRTLRHNAFMPHPHIELSVTRMDTIPFDRLKSIGETVAEQRQKALLGWAEINVSSISKQNLETIAVPLPSNRHHADIAGWPKDKPAQMILAKALAADATFTATELDSK